MIADKTVMVLSALFLSCKNEFEDEKIDNQFNKGTSVVAQNIKKIKDSGLLDNLISSARFTDDEYIAVTNFINNTDEVLNQIKNSPNGEQDLEVIEALFTNTSVTDFKTSFEKISIEGAQKFSEYMSTSLNEIQDDTTRCVDTGAIKLVYNTSSPDKGLYADNMNWDTIGWYSGYCASTIAGFCMFSYGGFWVKIAGVVAATAGSASMAVQLMKWNDCSDLGNFISSLINKDGNKATEILNKENGTKFLTIVSVTTGTVFACAITPFGTSLIKESIIYFNKIVTKVLSILPPGINYTINHIPIKLISVN